MSYTSPEDFSSFSKGNPRTPMVDSKLYGVGIVYEGSVTNNQTNKEYSYGSKSEMSIVLSTNTLSVILSFGRGDSSCSLVVGLSEDVARASSKNARRNLLEEFNEDADASVDIEELRCSWIAQLVEDVLDDSSEKVRRNLLEEFNEVADVDHGSKSEVLIVQSIDTQSVILSSGTGYSTCSLVIGLSGLSKDVGDNSLDDVRRNLLEEFEEVADASVDIGELRCRWIAQLVEDYSSENVRRNLLDEFNKVADEISDNERGAN